jgi:hypothetical protein
MGFNSCFKGLKEGNLKEQVTWKTSVGGSVEVYVRGIGIRRGGTLFNSYFRLLFDQFLVISCNTVPQ